MLYQVYETQRTMMEPFVDFAQAAAKLFSNPLSCSNTLTTPSPLTRTRPSMWVELGRMTLG